jgi:hypothetical protein
VGSPASRPESPGSPITNLFWGVARNNQESDAAVLAKLTLLPDVVWLAIFWFGTMAALIYGGARLLRLDQ